MKMKRRIILWTAVLLLVSLCGCAAANPPGGPARTSSDSPTTLTKEQSQAAALAHAGLTADQVQGLRTQYEVDDGIPEYEIEFRSGDFEYDYTIHAENGKVLEWDKEYDPVNAPTASTPAPEVPAEPEPEKLTSAEAEAIALKHADLTADQVQGLRTRYEVDDGIPEYEIEFRSGDFEYDYTIHAENGKVLEWDKEYDPVNAPPASTPAPEVPAEPEPEKLTSADAEAIALKHAGLTADQVKGLKTEYEVDDGVAEYSVEFYADGWEYEYEIDAKTGKILSWERDD